MTHSVEITSERMTEGLIATLMPMFNRHWAEVSAFPDVDLEPDYGWYIETSAKGGYSMTVARVDGEVVGYIGYLVGAHAHHDGFMVASQDMFYVDPLRRKGMLGLKLLRASELALKARGVDVILQGVTPRCDYSALLRRAGYVDASRMMQKRI